MGHQPVDRLKMARNPSAGHLIISRRWAWHEADTLLRQVIDAAIYVVSTDRYMLDALAFVAAQVFLNLAFVVGAFVDRDTNFTAGRGKRATGKASMFSLNVKEADFTEGESVGIEPVPSVHVTADDVVGEMVQIVEAKTFWARIWGGQPVKFGRKGAALFAVGIH